jgi:multicomponent Na+:H+ antiporter subunit B
MSVTVFAILRTRNLYAVVMLGSIYSLMAAAIFVILDAVDVALTEAAVGAGISTVLTLGTIALTTDREKKPSHTKLLPLIVVCLTGAALVYGTLDLAHYGDPNAPAQTHVGPDYIKDAPIKTGVPNVVTAILASYRGYDTLGEVVVVFMAGVGVILLLGNWRHAGRRKEEDNG